MSMVFCRGCGKEIHESAPACPHCGAPQALATPTPAAKLKSQTVAALLSAFLGGFGAQRFYLGPIWLAIIYLLLCWTGIPGLIAIVDTLIIVFSSQETWARKYNNGVVTPPAHLAVKILVLAFPVIAMIGILAAIAIPQYSEYVARAKVASVQSTLNTAQIFLTEHLMSSGGTPLSEEQQVKLKTDLKQNKEIIETDAFSFGDYADVGVQMLDGAQRRSFYMVTRDRGQTWQCISADNELRHLPKGCQANEALRRPAVPKPVQHIGLWKKTVYQDALKACVQRAQDQGNANGQQSCACILGKASAVIPEAVIQQDELPQDVKDLIQQMIDECSA
jgi:TM2 domain-containing membrane protein YozV/type II secretory pathway pseudopilin PulG